MRMRRRRRCGRASRCAPGSAGWAVRWRRCWGGGPRRRRRWTPGRPRTPPLSAPAGPVRPRRGGTAARSPAPAGSSPRHNRNSGNSGRAGVTVIDSALLSGILSSAGAGTALIVIMILTGVLSTKRYTDRIQKDADYWRAAAATERAASDAKDQIVAAAVQRADAAVEVAQLTKSLLEDLRRRTGEAQKAPQ